MFIEKNVKDITGKKFNHLIAIRFDKKVRIHGVKKAYCHYWYFKCDCGNIKSIRKSNVIKKNSSTISCGCINNFNRKTLSKKNKIWENAREKNITHNLSSSKFYKLFGAIKQRCSNINDKKYNIYGGRGIRCEWKSFEQFKTDMYESYLKHKSEFKNNTTIDRIDGNGNYSKENCRWATYKEQNNNLKNNRFYSHSGKTMCLSDWSKYAGVCEQTFQYRLLKYSDDIKLAIENPIKYSKRK